MYYYIQIDANNNIVISMASATTQSSPWIEVTQAQYASLVVGDTYVNNVVGPPAAAQLLATAQAAQISTLYNAYLAATAADVSYTSAGGVAETYQADQGSVYNLTCMQLGFQKSATTPTGFYWVATDNTQVPFTYNDLLGLAEVMATQGAAAFATLQVLKKQVLAATSVSAVQAITWP